MLYNTIKSYEMWITLAPGPSRPIHDQYTTRTVQGKGKSMGKQEPHRKEARIYGVQAWTEVLKFANNISEKDMTRSVCGLYSMGIVSVMKSQIEKGTSGVS